MGNGESLNRASNSGVVWFLFLSLPMFGYWLTNGMYFGRADSLLVSYALDVFVLVVWPLIAWQIVPRIIRPSIKELGLTSIKPNLTDIIQTSILCFVILLSVGWAFEAVAWAFLWKYDWITEQGGGFRWRAMIPTGPEGLFALAYLALSAGIVEELYFRGLLKHILYKFTSNAFRRPLFLLISSVAFGAIHWEGGLSKLVATTLFGYVAARLYLWLGTLWPLVFAHVTVNLLLL